MFLAEPSDSRKYACVLRLMRKPPEVKLLVNKLEQVRAGEREFQTNMAQKTVTKLVYTKICRCCCKPLGSNDHSISLVGEKSQREAIERIK